MKNLFTPNFGQIPYYLAGRVDVIEDITRALDNTPGDPNQTTILIGARGTGKTALLRTISNIADQRGWISVNTACLSGLLEDIIQQTTRKGASFLEKKEGVRFKSINVASVFGVEWEYTSGSQPNWRSRMTDILEALAEHDLGLLITIDEIDPTLDEMIQLASVYQLLAGDGRKIALLMAGLPHQVSTLLGNKSVSFLRRSAQCHLERISDADVETAFRATVDASGKEIDGSALREAVTAINGFPYMLQLVGYRSCQATGQSSEIANDAVARGTLLAAQDMRTRVLKATLDELSNADLAFLQAMLEQSGASSSSQIAHVLGKGSAHVSTYRRRLLEQGVIVETGRNRFDFALPMLRSYLPEYLESYL
ncbi:ATP-binding protein [Adlercreutzia sp. ZJ141]|uniref:ATP-binding protein n=1 Tax=Adlercreutzia sp. ZJ141 TaxID=2709406 RepID=UPI0013EB31DD|nr:ATP-binding protein [Adlercreutzia sp. ZJ141]